MSNEYSDEAMLREFLAEADEHFRVLERDLLELERQCEAGQPMSRERVDEMFRATHTVKGLASMFDFREVKELAHACENVLDRLRSEALALDSSTLDVLFSCVDTLKLATAKAGEGVSCASAAATLAEVSRFLDGGMSDAASGRSSDHPRADWSEYALHRLRETSAELDALVLSLRWGIELRQGSLSPESVERAIEGEIVEIRARPESGGSLESLDVDVADVTVEVLVLTQLSTESIADALGLAASRIRREESNPLTDVLRLGDPAQGTSVSAQAVRVDIRRLDTLMDLMGELVTARTRLVDLSAGLHDRYPRDDTVSELTVSVKEMSALLAGVQERVMRMRMVPVGQLFAKYPRAVRDIARAEKKEIRLCLSGEETELDKRLIEQIEDPILHLLRNACGHGIEPPDNRVAAGKPRHGTVTLSAVHEGGHIVIDVSDDGQGLDLQAIAAHAPGVDLDAGGGDSELLAEIIMQPGFSTADQVTDVSGRGVGLDVVQRCLVEIGGTIEVDSSPGHGTSFRLRLPLTLAIVPALLVRIGAGLFCVPLSVVSEVMRVRADQCSSVRGVRVLDSRGDTLPLISVGQLLNVAGYDSDAAKFFVVEVNVSGHRVGLLVDELAGRQEIVVKNLEDALGVTPGISGATILGDGSVAPILDVERIARLAGARNSRHEFACEPAESGTHRLQQKGEHHGSSRDACRTG